MTEWTARVEWTGPELSEDQLDEVMGALAEVHPALGVEREPGRFSAVVTVNARTMRRGFDLAVHAVQVAVNNLEVGAVLVGAEVLDSPTFDERSDRPLVPDLVTQADIARMLGVSAARAGQLAAGARFPREALRVSSGPLWIREHVQQWAVATGRQQPAENATTAAVSA